MPPKQRQVKMQQTSALAAMQQLESRSDEELLNEKKYRSAAMAIMGSRAAEKYDAKASREYYRRAMSAARPQERMALRRMADASLALAERRPDDLKAAVERLGQEAPGKWQLRLLHATRYLAPGPSASIWLRIRGVIFIILLVVAVMALGTGIVQLVGLAFGGVSLVTSIWLGLLLIAAVIGVLFFVGRRRQNAAKAKRAAQIAGS
jgi:hypothetical protein